MSKPVKINNTEQIQALRKEGAKVRILHWRYMPFEFQDDDIGQPLETNLFPAFKFKKNGTGHVIYNEPKINGGRTVVEVLQSDGRQLRGEATCSVKDNFNRRLGVKIAIGRLKEVAPEPRGGDGAKDIYTEGR